MKNFNLFFVDDLVEPSQKHKNKTANVNEYKRRDPKRDKSRKNDYTVNRNRKRMIEL